MEFFTCNNCKRSRRRTSSSGDEEHDDVTATARQRTTLRRGSSGGTVSNGCDRLSMCCASAVMYCYAARGRRDGRSRNSKASVSTRRTPTATQWPSSQGVVGGGRNLELPQLHHSSSPKSRSPAPSPMRGSILKNSSSSSDFAAYTATGSSNTSLTGQTSGWVGAENEVIPDIRRSSSPEKRASFNEAVDVIIADETGRQIAADSVRLKPPSVDGEQIDTDWENGRRSRGCGDSLSTACGTGGGGSRKTGTGSARRQHYPAYVYPPASRCRHAFSLASTNVERRPDGSRYLRAVIRPTTTTTNDRDTGIDGQNSGLGEMQRRRRLQQQSGCDVAGSERVIVRAGAKGSRLVVGAYRPEPLGDGTNYLKQYVDRFPLPHVIETQTIKADMQPTGVLVVTAAINESSDTDTD